ncbi:hypothetical protein ACPPVV_16745 [Rhodanobacter sp. Col0626]|uniref:hypothetical protein n=1 Tax=Rhodanobacter sp. Col0626 TaxID=3415679 RepID=UPI003CEF2413
MKNLIKLFPLALALVAGTTGVASAATVTSHSVKYLDESGVVVGQQYLLCNNEVGHGGNIHTAYKIDEKTGCGNFPQPAVIVPNTLITSYTLPGSVTISQACLVAECSPGYSPEVERLNRWTYSVGWQ